MSDEIDYYKNLARIMRKTSGIRFDAAQSLMVKERVRVSTVAFLSVYMLGWAVASLSYPDLFIPNHARFYNAVSVVASVALLAITMMDLSIGRSSRAEKLQANALEVMEQMRLMERLLAESVPDVAKLRQVAARYEKYVAQTAINHSTMDHQRWVYSNAKSGNPITTALLWARSKLYTFWYYSVSLFVYFLVVIAILGATVWYTVCVVFGATAPI